MEETRIKMVGDKTWAGENLISGITRLIREAGILSTFAGLPAMLAKQIPYTMGKQVSFDLFAALFRDMVKLQHKFSMADLKWTISLLAGFFASILACLCSQPGDMILTATYKSHGTSFTGIIRDIFNTHGLGGFYIGTTARIAHVASIITSQLVLYDIIKVALGLPMTGSH